MTKANKNSEKLRQKYPVKRRSKNQLAKEPDAVMDAVSSVYYWRGRRLVQNDVEVADRLNEFFQYCQAEGDMPTVEKLALALGTYVAKVKQWERGRDLLPRMTDATPELIKKAKQMIAATDAELVIRGNLNPLPYMFRAKNYYGMSDHTDSEVANVDKVQTKEELAQKYADVVDVEYAEKGEKK